MAKEVEVTGLKKFTTNPQIATYAAPTDDKEFAPKKYVDDNIEETQYFGDGSDGDLVATGVQTINLYAAIGSISGKEITPYNTGCGASGCANFCSAGDKILIIQMAGTNAGKWEIATVATVAYSLITVADDLTNTYHGTSGGVNCQMVRIPEYDNVSFKTGSSLNITAYNGEKGGICIFYAKTAVMIEEGIALSLNEKGYRGGTSVSGIGQNGVPGEGLPSTLAGLSQTTNNNGNGGGGGDHTGHGGASAGALKKGVNSFGNGTPGDSYIDELSDYVGGLDKSPFLSMGGGGGSGGCNGGAASEIGAKGGGLLIIITPLIISVGTITSNGGNFVAVGAGYQGGPAAGGTVALFSPMIYLENEPSVTGGDSNNASKGIVLKGYPDKCLPSS